MPFCIIVFLPCWLFALLAGLPHCLFDLLPSSLHDLLHACLLHFLPPSRLLISWLLAFLMLSLPSWLLALSSPSWLHASVPSRRIAFLASCLIDFFTSSFLGLLPAWLLDFSSFRRIGFVRFCCIDFLRPRLLEFLPSWASRHLDFLPVWRFALWNYWFLHFLKRLAFWSTVE